MINKILNIKHSWFGNWIEDSDGNELLMFHLTDDGTIVYTVKHYVSGYFRSIEITNMCDFDTFELKFGIDIRKLINEI